MKKILLCACLFLFTVYVGAQTLPAPQLTAKSWLLLDATSNQIIASHQPHMRIEPASLTKIMTAYLVFEALRDKKLTLTQMVNVSEKAWKVDADSSKMFIEPKTPVSINDLLYGLIVQSGNDAAVALAESVAGSEEAFVHLMNLQAKRMGLTETHFANPHGLPSSENYSTAYDLARLVQYLIVDYLLFYKTYYSTKSFTYNKITQPNRNRLLWLDSSVDGVKTGYTKGAGYGLISSAVRPSQKESRRFIAVVLGTHSSETRVQESLKLLNWGFLNFDTVKLYAKGEAISSPDVFKGDKSRIKIGFNRDIYITLPKGSATRLSSQLTRQEPFIAPIARNKEVGKLTILLDRQPITVLPVLALENIGAATIFGRAWDSVRLWLSSSNK